ncbi:MAG: VWA-like domain-containing protein [Nostocaceae cyanobacterium]|nr:VWA-like domain-containing protein [Nostocaceae cyanobacterium]
MTNDLEKIISASMLRLRMKSPFFATLALFARIIVTEKISTAATDGKDIFINPNYVQSLSSPQLDGLLLHEVLHAALLHVPRRGTREPILWNVAADIIVNGIIVQQQGFQLFSDGLRDKKLEHLSVEEVYEILMKDIQYRPPCELDLLYEPLGDSQSHNENRDNGTLDTSRQKVLETYWRNAMHQAIAVARTTSHQGSIPAGMEREIGTLTQAQLDWRSYLWRYLVRTPTDFTGFDRRFIGQKLYLESLEGESIQVFIAVDTSGSVCQLQLRLFLSEVVGILNSYPHIQCQLYYADADVYGPYELTTDSKIPEAVGGGGTSFIPFFDKIKEQNNYLSSGVCVYLTDGYGTFPRQPPQFPVLWVVTPGGLDLKQFPFGEAVRLLSVF